VAAHLPAYEFAAEVVRRLAPETQGQRRKIAVYLDPSNFKNIGYGKPSRIRSTSAGALRSCCHPGLNDRMGGWQLMYQMPQIYDSSATSGGAWREGL
jgi:hypothetical protein